jgi:hypothetical protein
MAERAAPDIGDGEQLGRAAPAAAGWSPRRARLDHVVGQQVVQVAPDGGRGQVQPGTQAGRGDRAVLHDQPGNPGAGAPLGSGLADSGRTQASSAAGVHPPSGARSRGDRSHAFHNISVS